MARARAAALVAGAIVLVACTTGGPSSPDAPRDVRGATITVPDGSVTGTVRRADGTPAGGAAVTLTQEANGFEQIGNVLAVAFTGGLACLDRHPGAPCAGPNARTASTGADGAYRLALGGTPAGGHSTDNYLLSTALPAAGTRTSGATLSAEFRLTLPNHVVPALTMWEPATAVAFDGPSAVSSFTLLPPDGLDQTTSYTLSYVDAQGGEVWAVPAVQSGQRLDARVLEDTAGQAIVTVKAHRTVDTVGYRLVYDAPGAPFRSPAGAPSSRGLPCALVRADGSAAATAAPCWLTDGDRNPPNLSQPLCPTTTTPTSAVCAPATTSAAIDLGAAQPIALVVVRGCGGCAVAVSSDGQAWSPYGDVAAENAALAATRDTKARFIQLSAPGGVDAARELSVWTAPDQASARRDRPEPSGLQPGDGGSSTDRGRWALAVVAAILIGLIGGVVLRERRRRS